MNTYYYKTKRAKKLKEVKASSKEKAIEALDAVGVNTAAVEFFTAAEAKKYSKKTKEQTGEELYQGLSDKAKEILSVVFFCDDETITKDKIQEYGLSKDIDLPYYIHIWWGSGQCGHFANIDGIKDIYIDKMNRSNDDGFDFTVYDSNSLDFINFEIDVLLKINGEGDWV